MYGTIHRAIPGTRLPRGIQIDFAIWMYRGNVLTLRFGTGME